LRWYGAGPLHLVALLAAFCLAGYAAARLVPGNPVAIAVWFVGAAIGHDVILLPLYTIADRSLAGILRHSAPDRLQRSGIWLNHVRVPAVLSAILFAIYFPLILRLPPSFAQITGRSSDPYLGRWLLVTGVLFAVSGVWLAVRLRRRRSPVQQQDRSPVQQQEMLNEQGGNGLGGEPSSGPGQHGTGGDQPDRER
jgi:hypothetical protein